METSEINSSGILIRGEELLESIKGYLQGGGSGVITITNKRFMFLKKPKLFSKGFHVIFECSLGQIVSVTMTGLISKQLNVQIRDSENQISIYNFKVGNPEATQIISEKLIGAKNEFIEDQVVETKNIIIQEGNKDNAVEILKKRLARGEITLEEFHDKIQRT
jgi:hypothetical protein